MAKADSRLALLVNGICQYSFKGSNLVTYVALPTLSIQSSIHGSGKESVLVSELSSRKSIQNCCVSSALGTNMLGLLHSLLLGSISSALG